jgi:ribose 5-phosphate isomerase B
MTNESSLIIALGADHGGFRLKDALAGWLRKQGHTVLDLGTNGEDSVDYPDYAHAVCKAVLGGQARFGVLVCGTGLGMSYAANRHAGIRCAMVSETTSTRLARQHNDANMLSLGGRVIGEEAAFDILTTFITTEFEGGRHERRIAKIETGIRP